jgi:hypothetical protein
MADPVGAAEGRLGPGKMVRFDEHCAGIKRTASPAPFTGLLRAVA